MKILLRRIAQELKTEKHIAVYEPELTRVWPYTGKRRELEIALFAIEHGLRLRHYKEGFCVIFDREPVEHRR